MSEPRKATYTVGYTFVEVQCPWCGNDQSFKAVFIDDIEGETHDCGQCHRLFYLVGE